MQTLQMEISDDLARQLLPYQNQLPQLLEVGLRTWQQSTPVMNEEALNKRILRVLAASGRVRLPSHDPNYDALTRHTPLCVYNK